MAVLNCKCGCGEKIIVKKHHKWYGVPKYIHGHNPNTNIVEVTGELNPFYGKKHSEESKKKISECQKKRLTDKKNHSMYRRRHSEESKKRMSQRKKGINGENHSRWKGGKSKYLHEKAWELFGQDKCEVCGMTNDEHKDRKGHRLSMHCDGHRYKNLERIFWTTCCEFGCHKKIERMSNGNSQSHT